MRHTDIVSRFRGHKIRGKLLESERRIERCPAPGISLHRFEPSAPVRFGFLALVVCFFLGQLLPIANTCDRVVFVLGSLEPIWIQQLSKPLRPDALAALTWASIVVNRGFAILLAGLTDHEDILPVEREHLIRVSLDVFG